jgi:putative ABC transport system permease protein
MINLAQKDIAYTLGKFVVTSMGVGMLLGIVLIMIGVYRGMMIDAQVLIDDIGADLWVVQGNTMGPFAEASRLHRDFEDTLAAFDGIAASEALTFQTLQLPIPGGEMRVTAVGFDPFGAFEPVNPARLIAGHTLTRDHYQIVVTDKTGYRVGDRIPLGRDTYTVVGVTHGTVSSGGEPLVFVSLGDAQQLQFVYSDARIRTDRARGQNAGAEADMVNAVVARVRPGYDVNRVAKEIRRWKHKSVYTQDQERGILTQNLIKMASKQIGMFTAILVVVSTIIIALIIYTMTLEKIREISIMKLIGIPNLMIVKMIVQETVLLGTLALGFGLLFSHLIYDKFPKRVVLLSPDAWMLFGVVLAASVLASFFGVHKVLKADPAAAIGG